VAELVRQISVSQLIDTHLLLPEYLVEPLVELDTRELCHIGIKEQVIGWVYLDPFIQIIIYLLFPRLNDGSASSFFR
jgi:hypothetical protein